MKDAVESSSRAFDRLVGGRHVSPMVTARLALQASRLLQVRACVWRYAFPHAAHMAI